MRFTTHILALVSGLFITGHALGQSPCAAHLGGSWFIGCKSLVSYQDQDIVTFGDWSDPIASVNLDVYGTDHKLQAQVRAGKLVKGSPERFKLKSSANEFSLVDGANDRVICILKKVPSTTKSASCQVDVWLDLYVAGAAGYFHCDPESSNEPQLQMMPGSTFKGMGSAVSLN